MHTMSQLVAHDFLDRAEEQRKGEEISAWGFLTQGDGEKEEGRKLPPSYPPPPKIAAAGRRRTASFARDEVIPCQNPKKKTWDEQAPKEKKNQKLGPAGPKRKS